jgi:RecA/RadA recombinase
VSFAEALAAQREAQAAYTTQLAAFADDEPDLERIAALGATAEAALARLTVAPTTLNAAEREALLSEAQRTADLLRQSHAAALSHIDRLAGEVARSERAGEALRAYLPVAEHQQPRYLDERR